MKESELKMKTYADLLRWKVFRDIQMAESCLKKNSNDSTFWWESNQIWGYTTKELVKKAINTAKEEDIKIKKSLIDMCNSLRMNEDCTRCDTYFSGMTVAEFIGL
jgi:purine-nucleoside phosphorylase